MEYEYEESEYPEEMDEIARIHSEIQEECQEYGENMQRSEDEGWFYPDDDGEQQ